MKSRIINVLDVPISISKQELNDYICITDIANKFNIDINKLIIKGIWNDPYNKKRTKV